MLKYPLSTLLYLAKINIKDTIQDALKLHNNIDVRLTITIKDKDGNIIKIHKQHSHSFVAQFLTDLNEMFTSGPNSAVGALSYSTGIQIGTGTTSPLPTDTALTSPIANGTGAGQMSYPSTPTFSSVSIKGNTASFTISSTIANNSGASITVSEVGLLSRNTSTGQFEGLLAHDLLSSPITVPNLSEIQITYTISVTT